ncbi:MAG: PfkB family carbohydrate kinase [Thermotogota bacterium]
MIDVYGGVFTDIYINGDTPHKKQIDIFPGGSGFNIALGLSILKNKVRFIGNIGNDENANTTLKILKDKGINIDLLNIRNEKSDIFISQNEKPFAIQRNNNEKDIKFPQKKAEYAFVNTEINKNDFDKIINLDYKLIFIDSGPRHFILKNYFKKDNHILISNKDSEISTDLIALGKMDIEGFYYKDEFYPSNGKKFKYKFGTGDLLDVIFIDYYLKNRISNNNLYKIIEKIEMTNEIKGAYNKIKTLEKKDGF